MHAAVRRVVAVLFTVSCLSGCVCNRVWTVVVLCCFHTVLTAPSACRCVVLDCSHHSSALVDLVSPLVMRVSVRVSVAGGLRTHMYTRSTLMSSLLLLLLMSYGGAVRLTATMTAAAAPYNTLVTRAYDDDASTFYETCSFAHADVNSMNYMSFSLPSPASSASIITHIRFAPRPNAPARSLATHIIASQDSVYGPDTNSTHRSIGVPLRVIDIIPVVNGIQTFVTRPYHTPYIHMYQSNVLRTIAGITSGCWDIGEIQFHNGLYASPYTYNLHYLFDNDTETFVNQTANSFIAFDYE